MAGRDPRVTPFAFFIQQLGHGERVNDTHGSNLDFQSAALEVIRLDLGQSLFDGRDVLLRFGQDPEPL